MCLQERKKKWKNCPPSSSFCSGRGVGMCCFPIEGYVAFLLDNVLLHNYLEKDNGKSRQK